VLPFDLYDEDSFEFYVVEKSITQNTLASDLCTYIVYHNLTL